MQMSSMTTGGPSSISASNVDLAPLSRRRAASGPASTSWPPQPARAAASSRRNPTVVTARLSMTWLAIPRLLCQILAARSIAATARCSLDPRMAFSSSAVRKSERESHKRVGFW
jgi:hypothetical protein